MAKTQKDKIETDQVPAKIPEILIVSPDECIGQEKNARYFMPEVFQQLVDNVKKDGQLESAPLVYRDGEKFRIISGHHRVDAAKQAGLEKIAVMVIVPKDKNEIISKQLSHNALVGVDDKMILAELFKEIDDINQKLASGLSSEIEKIEYSSLNFKIGTFKEFTIMFIPSEIERFDQITGEIEAYSMVKPTTEVRLADYADFERFKTQIIKIKKVNNIKSNAIALKFMLDVTEKYFNELKDEDQTNGGE